MSLQARIGAPEAPQADAQAAGPGGRGIFIAACINMALVFSVVLFFSLLGIFTRPVGFLATFWPANAILLGLFLRKPQLASALGWLAAFCAYIAADMLTGAYIWITMWLTLANLAGVATVVFMVRKFGASLVDMRRPFSMLYLFALCMSGSAAASIVGAGAAPALLDRGLLVSLGFWLTGELLNYMLILPLILTFPGRRAPAMQRKSDSPFLLQLSDHKSPYPLVALLLSVAMSIVVGGPGAIAFSVPALLWCALAYSLFATSLLTALACSFYLIAISISWVDVPFSSDFIASTISLRMGILLIALAPLTVASISATRIELLRSLEKMASYDELTNALSRRAFMARAPHVIDRLRDMNMPFSVIMLDIDHFKLINDAHGHAVGDRLLAELSARLQQTLRQDDLLGRLGGDEFAIVLPGLQQQDAQYLARRLCACVENAEFVDEDGRPMSVTISLGFSFHGASDTRDLDILLSGADKALYRAKSAGKNQVAIA